MLNNNIETEHGTKVSVIIPVYNVEAWLPECLDSAINQTLRNIEIICVNDGSTDNSPVIIDDYIKRDNRIKLINQANRGIGEARNAGIREAEGEYLYFMDGDDYLDTDALKTLADKMDEYDLQLVCFNVFAFGDDKENIDLAIRKNKDYYHRELEEDCVFSGAKLYQTLFKSGRYLCPVWLNLVRRDFILENDLWFHPSIMREDELWTFAVMLSAERVGCINKQFYYRRYRSNSNMTGGVSFEKSFGYFYCAIDMMHKAEKWAKEDELVDIIRSHIRGFTILAINDYRNCNEEQKKKQNLLPIEQQVLFQQMVAFPAELCDNLERTELEKRSAADERNALQNAIEHLKDSRSFKIGYAIMLVPKKVKRFIGKLCRGVSYCRKRRYIRNKKIVLQLKSRLGNHMFIYALQLKLKSMGRNVVFDTETMTRLGQAGYNPGLLTEAFSLELEKADHDDIKALQDSGLHKSDVLRRKLKGDKPLIIREIDYYAFDERFLENNSGYFIGWYQNSRYFEGIKKEIRNAFRFRSIPKENIKAWEMEKRILEDNSSVSVHVRFGDYMNEVNNPKFGGFCTEAYYESAIDVISLNSGKENINLYVFSDDIPRAKLFLRNILAEKQSSAVKRIEYVNVCNTEEGSWIDMYLMSICHHNIIANSTFSWWGAWLNGHDDKIVISPAIWYRNQGKNYPGVLMNHSIRIDADGLIAKR